MRVVLDTSVLISGTLGLGPSHRCIRAAEAGLYEMISANEILEEFGRVLRDKFRHSVAEADELVQRIRATGVLVPLTGRGGWILADPSDDKLVEAALAAAADAIVTGDKDLLRLGRVGGIPVWTPRQLLDRLSPAAP